MTNFTLRPAVEGDAAAIADIDTACGAPQEAHRAALVPELLKFGMSWIAEADGAAAGYAIVSKRFFSRPFVELLAIAPASRRHGMGTALMGRCESAHDGDVLFTSTNESNASMRALLAKAGYRASGIIYNLDPDDPELVFAKFRAPA